ncbi:MAG: HD domain-containing protein [Chlorobi bacterium]|nr:HD domain-containing protein [Chlorobiota bacterium]
MKKCLDHPVFRVISDIVTRRDVSAYVIGGFVRDCILGRDHSIQDIDILIVGKGIEIAREVASSLIPKPKVSIFKRFGTAMFRYGDMEIDFVGARKESYSPDSRKPAVEEGTLEDDQRRRDFTVNAMAISLKRESYGAFIDPFNGLKDLQDRILRTPLDPDVTFSDDPLRMMRAIRFATELDFQLSTEVEEGIRKNRDRISIVSMERITTELNKIMMADTPSRGFLLMDKTGLLAIILPEVYTLKGVETREGKSHKDVFLHTLQVLDNISRKSDNLWLRWAALLHDIAKPATKKFMPDHGWTFHGHEFLGSRMVPRIFRNLKLPLHERTNYVSKLVALHLRPIALVTEQITDSALRRLIFDAGDDLEDLMTLCEADITSRNPGKVRKHLNNFKFVRLKLKEIEDKDAIRNFQPPVSGEEIMKIFGIPPSKTVGIIKEAIKDAILDGKIHNSREEALRLMYKLGEEIGLKPADQK